MPWVSPKEAAAVQKCSLGTLRSRARRGLITRQGGRYFVDGVGVGDSEQVVPLPPAQPTQTVEPGAVTPPAEARVSRIPDPNLVLAYHGPSQIPVEKWIIIPDCHVPYHHAEYFSLVIRVGLAIQASNVLVLGDFMDCYSVSRFPKHPSRRVDMKWEFDETNRALDLLDRAFPGTKKITLGNHEKRMERFIADKAPELAGLMKIEQHLKLAERGWLVTDYMDHTNIGKLCATHEVGGYGQNAHIQAQQIFNDNVVIGHTHRLSWAVIGSAINRPHVCAMLGWLGDPSQIDYQHRAAVSKASAHGFGVAYVEPDGLVHLQPVAIVQGHACVEGRIIT